MKGNNIGGNGSKATLPGGKKLSDKVQENKTKNQIKSNSISEKGSNSVTPKDGKENQENKQSQAQATGKEAAREALKKAAGTIPLTKWIPKGIRDKIIDRFMDSEAGEAAVEKGLKRIKVVIVMGIVAIVGSFVMTLLIFVVIISAIVAPVAWIGDVIAGVADFFKSVGNWFIGNGWCTDLDTCQTNAEYKYYEKLDAAVAKYKGSCEINEDLITATIFYGQMVSEEPLNLLADGEEGEYGGQEQFNYIDVSEKDLKQPAKDQINKLIKVYLKGEDLSDDEKEELAEKEFLDYDQEDCAFSAAKYKDYLIEEYIDWAYPSVVDDSRTKEVIADEIIQMGGLAVGGSYESAGEIIISAGLADSIPNEILSNCVSPLGYQQTSHTSCFGFYNTTKCNTHNGIDLGSTESSPKLYSIADGEIVTVRRNAVHCQANINATPICPACPATDGNRITIKHSVKVNEVTYIFYSEYMHMDKISAGLSVGTRVTKGQEIGIMGNTGCSTARHLHFNMLDANKRRYNPEELLRYLNLPMKSTCNEIRRICTR